MGGLGPGIGGFEIVVIGLVALLVVGPKDLPVLMRRVGQMVAKARAMANEFRSSFDEMARQSELDDLRKEVEALRSSQPVYPLGKEAEDAFKHINTELNRPIEASPAASPDVAPPVDPVMTPAPSEWPDVEPAHAEPADALKAKPAGKAASAAKRKPTDTAAKPRKPKPSTAKPKPTPKKAADL
jgi:sec-independent protein translocase protein TatB